LTPAERARLVALISQQGEGATIATSPGDQPTTTGEPGEDNEA
jgi:hypothetical protein